MRDLEADLAICEAATPGPWNVEGSEVWLRGDSYHGENPHIWICDAFKADNARFIAAARTGWPEAIRRALSAEERVDKLEHELRMLHDIINSNKA